LYDWTGTPPWKPGGFHLIVIYVFEAETCTGAAGASGTKAARIVTGGEAREFPS